MFSNLQRGKLIVESSRGVSGGWLGGAQGRWIRHPATTGSPGRGTKGIRATDFTMFVPTTTISLPPIHLDSLEGFLVATFSGG